MGKDWRDRFNQAKGLVQDDSETAVPRSVEVAVYGSGTMGTTNPRGRCYSSSGEPRVDLLCCHGKQLSRARKSVTGAHFSTIIGQERLSAFREVGGEA